MQIFPRSLNRLPTVVAVVVLVAGPAAVGTAWYYFSPLNLQIAYAPEQPVRYSHRLHVGKLGMDCRYCHANVERSAKATVPATQVCMGCHAVIKQASPLLAKVRESFANDRPIPWVLVHRVADFAYFDHSIHVARGVGCRTCHGRVDQMEVVQTVSPLSMSWCLECHRNPGPSLRPLDRITDMQCAQTGEACAAGDECCSSACEGGACQPVQPRAVAANLVPLAAPEHCSGCHR